MKKTRKDKTEARHLKRSQEKQNNPVIRKFQGDLSSVQASALSYDEATRSIGIAICSDAAIDEYDHYSDSVIPTVLIPEGIKIRNGQTTLVDEHDLSSTKKVHGSVREMSIETGKDRLTYLIGRAYFAEDKESDDLHLKMRDKHITDVSVHTVPTKVVYLKSGESQSFHDRPYTGRMKVVVESQLIEVSATAMGGDPHATTRSKIESDPKPQKKGTTMKMSKLLRSKLISLGLDKDAADEKAWEFFNTDKVQRSFLKAVEDPATPVVPAATPVVPAATPVASAITVGQTPDEAVAIERSRIKGIKLLGKQFSASPEIIEKCIEDGTTVQRSLTLIASDESSGENIKSTGKVTHMENKGFETFKKDAADAIIMRSLGPDFFEGDSKVSDGARSMRFDSLDVITRNFLRYSNQDNTPGSTGQEHIKRAMSTSDFADIFESVAQRILLNDYKPEDQTWRQWCSVGSVTNFKINETIRLSEFDELDELPEGAEYKYGTIEGNKELFKIATFGKAFKVTRQTIINDDIEAISSTPRRMGRAAARTLENLAYDQLLSNPALSDGKPVFHSTRYNIATLNLTSPSVDSLDEMELLLGAMKDLKGIEILDLVPGFLLLPKELKKATETFFRSARFDVTAKDATRENIYHGSDITRIYTSRLSADDKFKWYMLEATKDLLVKMYFLNGVQTPFFDKKENFNNDSMEWKVRIDAGAAPADPRGVILNPGK